MKLNSIVRVLLLTLPLYMMVSCSKPAPGEIDKCVLVYMATNNNLTSSAISDMEELEKGYVPDFFKVGSSGDVLLVYCNLKGEPPRLIRFSKDRYGNVGREIIKEYEEHNSVDPEVMSSILDYVHSIFPARENGLILSSHGTGWLPKYYMHRRNFVYRVRKDGQITTQVVENLEDPFRHMVRSFGVDDNKGTASEKPEMEIFQLRDVLKKKYDFLIFDACLMGGVEVVYELRDKADYIVSSAAEMMVESFDYTTLMGYLFQDEADLEGLCEDYYQFHLGQSSFVQRSGTISLVKTGELPALAEAARPLFDKYRDNIPCLDMSKIQGYFRFNKHFFYDLTDMVDAISEDDDPLFQHFLEQMDRAVVFKKALPYFMEGDFYDGFPIHAFSGLSTYVQNPENPELDTYYTGYQWNKDTGMIK